MSRGRETERDRSLRRFQAVREVVNRYGPARLLSGRESTWNGEQWVEFDRSIDDEYDAEVKGILKVLAKSNDARQVQDRVERVFDTMFAPGFCRDVDWRAMSGELWDATQRPGW